MDNHFSNELMDYLYNEMRPDDRKKFELRMEADPALRKEMEDLKAIRGALGELKDKEVMEPVTLAGPTGPYSSKSGNNHAYLWQIITIAASVSLLLITGYLTDFSIRYNDDGLYVGFAKNTVKESMDEEKVQSLISDALNQNNATVMRTLEDQGSHLEMKIDNLQSNMESIEKSSRAASGLIPKESLDGYMAAVQENNLLMLKEYLQLTNEQQQVYLRDLMNQYSNFVQEQREEDLTRIGRSLLNLKQDQEIQKQETDQVLANLLISTNTRNN